MKLLISILFLILFTFSAYAQQKDEYMYIVGGYAKNIAENVHDKVATSYASNDQKDDANFLGFGYGMYF